VPYLCVGCQLTGWLPPAGPETVLTGAPPGPARNSAHRRPRSLPGPKQRPSDQRAVARVTVQSGWPGIGGVVVP
jgi:hypothetical protein